MIQNKIMKKILFVIISLFLILVSLLIYLGIQVLGECSSKKMIELDLLNNSEPKANKILYGYFKETSRLMPIMNTSEIESVKLSDIKAFEVDLNRDNQKEVVGVVFSPLTRGKLGYELFILQKNDKDKYYNLSNSLIFNPAERVYILTTHHNGYRNIIIPGSRYFGYKYFVVRYENNMYYNDKLFKTFTYYTYFNTH